MKFTTGVEALFLCASMNNMAALQRIARLGRDDLLVNCVSFIMLGSVFSLCAAFVFTRVYMVHARFNELVDERERDAWLLEQCTTDAFYHNMKHHSDICDSVSSRQRDSLLMKATSSVLQETLQSGSSSVYSFMADMFDWALGRGIVASTFIFFVLLCAPTLMVPVFRRQINRMADQRLHNLHHAPYGHERYVSTAHKRHITPWNDHDFT